MVRRTAPARSNRGGAARRRQTRRQERDDEIPEVYREMLAEAEARESQEAEAGRSNKRRKVGERSTSPSRPEPAGQEANPPETSEDVGRQIQTAYDSTASEESDMEWEEVDIQQAPSNSIQTVPYSADEPLQITLDQHKDTGKRIASRRKPVTGAEKKLRLDVHKAHLLCLLGHVHIRNLWCNDELVQGFLKQMLHRKVKDLLNPAEDKPQYTRSITFVDGLNQASEAFARRFKTIKPGLQRAHWADDSNSLNQRVGAILSNAEVLLSRDDFRKQAETLQGSRDFGAQLFCALLRSVAVEARLVCSLQPLPFSGATTTGPKKPESQSIIISAYDNEVDEQSQSDATLNPAPRKRRLGQPRFAPSSKAPKTSVRTGPRPSLKESSYPVFWVEAYNDAVQKWIPVDPLVTKSLAKPSKFEPPASDQYNVMSYVVAFEEDASARDVTRRYAKAFSAKTRKLRVESTRNGERWWGRALRYYEKPFLEDRDGTEVSELTAKVAAEPMPRNVQDFKNHPIYALEQHLRRNEVIHPKRVIGQVSLGKSGSKGQKLEPVYRRTDIHACRSADGWYRLGRDIKIGEQPLKRVRANRNKFSINDDDEDDGTTEVPVYAHFQTNVYRPPPVVQGKIPKNVYGNLDIYTPTMVPPGGVHINHPAASQAAKILGIDYADAVTGFDFKGRHGTAVIRGAIIASEYREALEEVLNGLEHERLQAELEVKSAEALGMWKHFLLKLRIAERVKGYAVEGEEGEDETAIDADDASYGESEEGGGGFFPEPDQAVSSRRPVSTFRDGMEPDSPVYVGGGFVPESGFEDDEALGGGFEPEPDFENDEALGGGFIPEETPQDTTEPQPLLPSNTVGDTEYTNTAHRKEPSHFNLVVVPHKQPDSAGKVGPGGSVRSTVETASLMPEIQEETPGQDVFKDNGNPPGTVSTDPTATEDPEVVSEEVAPRDVLPAQSRASQEDNPSEHSDNEEGSLLSEDPEDEDAIPEWLM